MLKTKRSVRVLCRVLVCATAAVIFLVAGLCPRGVEAGTQKSEYASNPFISAAKNVRPAVVQITTSKIVTKRYWDPFGGFGLDNPLFDEFFGGRQRRQRREDKHKEEGLGSGFIVDKEGYILTNYHVIKDVDEIQVKLSGEKVTYKAEVIGEPDIACDVAVIKIDAGRKLPAVTFGDSDKLQIGEWVMAIGNPFGLEQTLTVGVISAKGRSGFAGMPRYQDFIQTDASINMGNSGGPLVNTAGEVVGINTFIISPYIAHGLGFAVPINVAKVSYGKIRSVGKVLRGYLGIIPQDLDPAMVKKWNLPSDKGVVVGDVEDGMPADKAGLKVQDVIVEFDGKKVLEEDQFRRMVADSPPGKKVKVRVIREGKTKTLTIALGELPVEGGTKKKEEATHLGLRVCEITPAIAERYNLGNVRGVLVTEVEGGSPAERKILAGDIIKKVNARTIVSLSDYYKALEGLSPGDDVILHIKRGKNTIFVVLKAE